MGAFSSYESIERLARDCGADSIDDVNAATAMLALKHGPKVFTEPFQNGAPVITSSPSEDHTYSAGGGGSTTGSGASTPLTNGNAAALNGNAMLVISNGQQNGCGSGDNQSNCASSDAAYESSEENHNITLEELEDQQRHRDGVDALLSLSRSSVVDSCNSRSPTKRSSSTSVEEEHTLSCLENSHNTPNGTSPSQGNKVAVLSNGAGYNTTQQQHPSTYHAMFADGNYNAPSYYGSSASQQQSQQLQPQHHPSNTATATATASASAAAKKLKPLRSLRTKMKRKTWVR